MLIRGLLDNAVLLMGLVGLTFPAAYFRYIAPRGNGWSALWVLLAAAWSVLNGIVLGYSQAGDIFGFIYCLVPLLAFAASLGALLYSYYHAGSPGEPAASTRNRGAYRAFASVCAFALLLLQSAPVSVASAVNNTCSATQREYVEAKLQPALEAYRRDHGEYPAYSMASLVPTYLAAEPSIPCAEPQTWFHPRSRDHGEMLGDFAVLQCYKQDGEGDWVVTFSNVDPPSAYNLRTHTWAPYDPLDGPDGSEACGWTPD